MKTKINHILPVLLLTAASGLTTVSCNDFLDKTPDNRTELNTDQKIAKLLVSAYPDVSPNELFELYSDNSDDSGPTYGYYQLSEKECYNWEDTKEEYQDTPNSLWGGYYGAISAANMALKAIEEKGNPASLNPQRGEALVCRAYCHFMLATIFCNAYDTHASESLGIPYMEDVETTVSPRYERGTLEEVTSRAFYESVDAQAYMHVVLTDEEDAPGALARLRAVYPNLLRVSRDNRAARSLGQLPAMEEAAAQSPLELFAAFYERRNGAPLSGAQKDILQKLIADIWEGEGCGQ